MPLRNTGWTVMVGATTDLAHEADRAPSYARTAPGQARLRLVLRFGFLAQVQEAAQPYAGLASCAAVKGSPQAKRELARS